MVMQTIPSRLTIWTSFKGLPTASPFFRAKRNDAAQFGCAVLTDSASHAKRNDAARRSDGTRKLKSPWGGTLGQPHGLFNFLALVRTSLADLLACVLRRRCRPLRRQSCAIYSFAAPAPNVRRCCGRLFTIRTCQRDSRSFLAYILFQALLRCGDLPVVKTKNPVSVQLFCDCGLSFVLSNQKRAADQPICCAFTPRYALWRPAAVPNRKKVAIRGVFLFLGSLDRLERRSGTNLGPAREQGGLGSAAGAFGRALGGVPGVQCWAALGTGLLAGVVEWHQACATNEGLGFMPGA